jgi:hypothetical protein
MRNKKRSASYIYYMLRGIFGNSANLKRIGLLFSFYFALSYQFAKADAIPFSIIDLCNLSDIVVSAKIIDVIAAGKIPDYSYSIAKLKVISVLKGGRENSEILIHYNPYIACPPSPRFSANTYVIVFIDYLDDRNIHTVFASGRGVLELSEAKIQVFENKIKDLVPLVENMQINIEKITEWLVSSFENLATRDEAARALRMGAYKDFFSSESGGWQSKYDFAGFLNKKQKKRIYNAIITSERFDYSEYNVVSLCRELWDDRLIEVMMTHVRDNVDRPSSITIDIMSMISDFMELEEGKALVIEDKALKGDPSRWGNRAKIARKFIELIESKE